MPMDPTDRSVARQIIKALRSGATPSQFADKVFVGQELWFKYALQMMEENSEDKHFEVRFIRAAYGGGKTLFIRRLESAAREQGWATAYILLRHGKVELDKPKTLAAELGEQIDLGEQGRGIASLLRAAVARKAVECGIVVGRTSTLAAHMDLENRMRDLCSRKLIGGDVATALRQACRAYVKHDLDRLAEIAQWLSGGSRPLHLLLQSGNTGRAQILKPLGVGVGEELIRIIAELTLMAGKKGLYIALDEVELIASFPERRRANAFQTLRALVDQNDMNTLPPATSIFLAATPQMFEDKKMFPSYKALQDRIETLPSIDGTTSVNFKANIVDLDATQLGVKELNSLGNIILDLWSLSGEIIPAGVQDRVDEIAETIVARGDYMIARPRLFCRLIVDMLDGALGADISTAAALRATEIKRARDQEVVGQ